MSTPLGVTFAQSHGGAYSDILEQWGVSLKGVSEITDEMKAAWVADLRQALEEPLLSSLLDKPATSWKRVGKFSSSDSMKRFAQVAVRRSLAQDHFDLLDRLHRIAQEEEPNIQSLQAAITVGTILKRVPQTIAQIYDMVVDKFNYTVKQAFKRKGSLTGRRRWRTNSPESRHAELDGQIKGEDERFNYKGNSIKGPRPVGGSPDNWSGCSCTIQYERSNGDWTSV